MLMPTCGIISATEVREAGRPSPLRRPSSNGLGSAWPATMQPSSQTLDPQASSSCKGTLSFLNRRLLPAVFHEVGGKHGETILEWLPGLLLRTYDERVATTLNLGFVALHLKLGVSPDGLAGASNQEPVFPTRSHRKHLMPTQRIHAIIDSGSSDVHDRQESSV